MTDLIKVEILTSDYYLVHVEKYMMKEISHSILNLIMYEDKKNQILCFTETDEEISMILSREMYNKLPDMVSKSKMTFKVLKSFEFEDRPGLISKFTDPLARSEISIGVISTFSELYLLIETEKENLAISSLKETNHFDFHQSENNSATYKNYPTPTLRSENENKITNKLIKLPFVINVISFPFEHVKDLAYSLIQLIFYPQNSERFFSLTISESEVCLFVEKEESQKFLSDNPNVFKDKNEYVDWVPLQICEGYEAHSQHGILDKMAGPLAKENVQIENLSTFNTNFVFVKVSQLEQAREILKQFEIESDDY